MIELDCDLDERACHAHAEGVGTVSGKKAWLRHAVCDALFASDAPAAPARHAPHARAAARCCRAQRHAVHTRSTS